MSGGIAYVCDGDGTFPKRLNREMVDLDPLDDEDRTWLRQTVQRHRDETQSTVAQGLLTNWDASVERFAKVMPKDYKRVLLAMREAAAEGRSVDEAVMAAAHG